MAKDTQKQLSRKIIQGVTFPEAVGTRTYVEGEEDELERRMTPEQYERLSKIDPPVLAGEWNPQGQGEPPMARSKAANEQRAKVGAGPPPGAPAKPHPAELEAQRLRDENSRLRKAQQPAGDADAALKAENEQLKAELDKLKAAQQQQSAAAKPAQGQQQPRK